MTDQWGDAAIEAGVARVYRALFLQADADARRYKLAWESARVRALDANVALDKANRHILGCDPIARILPRQNVRR